MPKNNYDHLLPDISDFEKDKFRRKILDASKNLDESIPDKIKYDDWERLGIDPAETVFAGPWTAKEFLAKMGIQLDNLGNYTTKENSQLPYDRKKVLEAFARCEGTLQLGLESEYDKRKENVVNTVHISADAQKRMKELSEPEGEHTLTLWDKFWGFFGFKTEHARAVEKDRAGLEVYKEKQQELSKKFAVKTWESKANAVVAEENNMSGRIDAAKANAKAKQDSWNKVFFGDKQVPAAYTMSDGKQISALSLCLAALQQRTKNEVSSMQPDVVLQNMAKNPEYAENIRKIGEKISHMVEMKNKAIEMGEKFKTLDNFLFEKSKDGLSVSASVDRQLKEFIMPDAAKGRPFALNVAADYDKMKWSKEKADMFGNAAVVLKAKDEMRKLFGKNDPVFGAKYEKAAADMEKNIRDVFKTFELIQALEDKNYDAILKATGFGNDYNKLGDALDASLDKFYDVNAVLGSGKEKNTAEKVASDKVNDAPEAENDEAEL